MPTPNPEFRPNVDRSIQLFGEVTEELINKLAPEILRLRSDGSHAPITVYINSRGGTAHLIDYLYGLLTAKGVYPKRPRIITVAIGDAGSAAATMLALGDYAVAYPKATIHFHGMRFGKVEDVTMEDANWIATELKNKNRATASALASAGTKRLALLYARSKEQCAELRNTDASLSEVECFASCLKEKISFKGDKIVNKAIERWKVLKALSEKVLPKVRRRGHKGIQFESDLLRGIISYEVQRNRSDSEWCLDAVGLGQIMSDFLLVRDYDTGRHVRLIGTLVNQLGIAFFSEAEMASMDASSAAGRDPDAATQAIVQTRVDEVIKPFCYFAASIWQHLQEEENPLTPRDAYWLGVVDEVYDTKLPSVRSVVEAEPEQVTIPETSEPSPPSHSSPTAAS